MSRTIGLNELYIQMIQIWISKVSTDHIVDIQTKFENPLL